jgi:hypothetical protein
MDMRRLVAHSRARTSPLTRLGHSVRIALVALAALPLLLWPGTAAASPQVGVSGGGTALLTYPPPPNTVYELPAGPHPATFSIEARLAGDGTATGRLRFVVMGAGAHDWGISPDVDSMDLRGTVTGGTVAGDGTITLTGAVTEVDRSGGKVVYTDTTPFGVHVLGPNSFTVVWCLFDPFTATVIDGTLRTAP